MSTIPPADPESSPYSGVVAAVTAALPHAEVIGVDEHLIMCGDCDPVPVARADARLSLAVRLRTQDLPLLLAFARGVRERCDADADTGEKGARDALVIEFEVALEHSPELHALPACDAAHFYAALRFSAVCTLEWEEEPLARLSDLVRGTGITGTPVPVPQLAN